jgi:hypothetical protein
MSINNKQLIYHYYLQTSRHSLTSFSRIIQTDPITPPSLRKNKKGFMRESWVLREKPLKSDSWNEQLITNYLQLPSPCLCDKPFLQDDAFMVPFVWLILKNRNVGINKNETVKQWVLELIFHGNKFNYTQA